MVFELMNDKALEVGGARRREVAIETMRSARANVAWLRRAARTVVWAVGRVSATSRRRRALAASATQTGSWESPTATWE
jgi:hypothetical protein